MLGSFAARIAVVTGAGNGIGQAMALRFAKEGMRLAVADIEPGALATTRESLRELGAEVIAAEVDVSDEGSLQAFADRVLSSWGPPHLLCNNAGVGGGWSPVWAATRKDWDWMLGVNLYGVVHGVRAFLPAMLEGGDDGHIVNTSSVAGLMTGQGQVYDVTKHAVQRLTEGLWYDLRALNSRVGVSALCPGIVATKINTAARNRPADMIEEGRSPFEGFDIFEAMDERYAETGMRPEEVVDLVVDAVQQDRFYILTDEWVKGLVARRAAAIVEGFRPPSLPRSLSGMPIPDGTTGFGHES